MASNKHHANASRQDSLGMDYCKYIVVLATLFEVWNTESNSIILQLHMNKASDKYGHLVGMKEQAIGQLWNHNSTK